MGRMVDLTGDRFGELVVIKRTPSLGGSHHVRWICRCSCGKETIVRSNFLKSGNTKSCGHLVGQLASYRLRKRFRVDPIISEDWEDFLEST